jgi:hypothetical protein
VQFSHAKVSLCLVSVGSSDTGQGHKVTDVATTKNQLAAAAATELQTVKSIGADLSDLYVSTESILSSTPAP